MVFNYNILKIKKKDFEWLHYIIEEKYEGSVFESHCIWNV